MSVCKRIWGVLLHKNSTVERGGNSKQDWKSHSGGALFLKFAL